jgi:hypothetical protein
MLLKRQSICLIVDGFSAAAQCQLLSLFAQAYFVA